MHTTILKTDLFNLKHFYNRFKMLYLQEFSIKSLKFLEPNENEIVHYYRHFTDVFRGYIELVKLHVSLFNCD